MLILLVVLNLLKTAFRDTPIKNPIQKNKILQKLKQNTNKPYSSIILKMWPRSSNNIRCLVIVIFSILIYYKFTTP